MKTNKTTGTEYTHPITESTPQSVEKEVCEHQINSRSICIHCDFIPQSNTLGTTMEDRFDEKFLNPDEFDSSSLLHPVYNNGKIGHMIEDIKVFINKEIAQSKAETIKEIDYEFCGNMHIIREEAGKNQLLLISKIMKAFKRSLLSKNE